MKKCHAYFPLLPSGDVNTDNLELLTDAVANLHREVDFVVVSCHWGISEGGTHIVCRHQKAIGRAAIDAGTPVDGGIGENVTKLMEKLCARYGTRLTVNAETGEVLCSKF
jgi:hypothetical protein